MAEKPKALATGAHPDDIEFMMAGTLLRLADAGWEVHYLNITNGSCGTAVDDYETIVTKRTAESRRACQLAGFEFHDPLADDLAIYYTPELAAKVSAVVRKVGPSMVFTLSPDDYMEDHQNACRLTVTAAFTRGMRNAIVDPPTPPVSGNCVVYHALPYGLADGMRRPVTAELYIDIGETLQRKRDMLACHASQKEWLDTSQGLDSYLTTMEEMSAEVGRRSGRFGYAEGWRRRGHLGFTPDAADNPLLDVLGG